MKQHVAELARCMFGWFDDFVITKMENCQAAVNPDIIVYPPLIFDHGLLIASIPLNLEPSLFITRRVCHWRNIPFTRNSHFG